MAEKLKTLHLSNLCLLAVPRGGVVVAAPIAVTLDTVINLLVTRKIGHPANEEVAIGAVMPDGSAIFDQRTISNIGITDDKMEGMIKQGYSEIVRRQLHYIGSTAIPDMNGKEALIVDDGIATGYTIRAAIQWLKTLNPSKIIVAVPIAPPDVVANLSQEVDKFICLVQPDPFSAVGAYYKDFSETKDQEVMQLLQMK
ncbi:phosphoribosyltransferase [Pelosinus sp. sgz500959]|uniref:phosphoribosyltransferase n=1 Tax=Pelosinus sp. sgz500959 TaxID=3242472 RepID=UPI0036719F88